MSWQLIVYTPQGGPHVPGSQIASYSAASPGGIVEGFHWSSDPYGNCIQLEFSAVPRLVNIPPRAVVQLIINNIPAFYGYITRSWPTNTGRVERYVATGAVHLLRQRHANVNITQTQDIAQVVHTVMGFRHPAIRHTGAPPNTGFTLSSFKAPWVDIATILKDLSGAAGSMPHGVRADGSFFFQRSSSTTAVRYADSNFRYLPVEGSEVADVVRLFHPETGYTYTYNAGLGYGSERTVIVPQMHNYMYVLPGFYSTEGTTADLYGSPTPINASWLRDDSLTTGHVISHIPPSSFCPTYYDVRGLNFVSSLIPGVDIIWRVQASMMPLESPGYPQSLSLGMRLHYSNSAPDLLLEAKSGYASIPPDAYTTSGLFFIVLGGYVTNWCTPYRFVVYQFAVYIPNDNLSRLAASLIQPPYQTPSEIHIPGYNTPTTHLTLLGAPSGDITGPVSVWEYVYTVRDGIYSIAKIGSKGSAEEADAIKIMATQISAEGDTRLRW